MEEADKGSSRRWLRALWTRLRAPGPASMRYPPDAPPRVLFYCASNIGMGHLGRVTRIAARLRELAPRASLLIVTDAKDLTLAAATPDLAVMKLPSFAFDEGGAFQDVPQGLRIDKRQLQAIRQNTLRSLMESYQPHVVYMDTLPHGKRDEMLPALRYARRRLPRCQIALCMRDLPCPPDEEFKFSGPEDKLRKAAAVYDHLLVAGDRRFFDLAAAYYWPEWLAQRLVYLGFVTPRVAQASGEEWERSMKILRAVRAARARGAFDVRLSLFTGPAIGDSDYANLEKETRDDPATRIERFSPRFDQALARADLAILQAGSTVFQILDSDIPILLHARDYTTEEQGLRAKLLAKVAGVELIDPNSMSEEELAGRIERALQAPRVMRKTGFDFDGVEKAAQFLKGIAD
ncbi:MAG: hypothetical protein NTW86_06395 [Candidatus Sumerlaeota bacterium]|nr:hypothetical protein [Candidatus Sumerlaeota bacterium]